MHIIKSMIGLIGMCSVVVTHAENNEHHHVNTMHIDTRHNTVEVHTAEAHTLHSAAPQHDMHHMEEEQITVADSHAHHNAEQQHSIEQAQVSHHNLQPLDDQQANPKQINHQQTNHQHTSHQLSQHISHPHQNEHGGQIYTVSRLKTQWLNLQDDTNQWKTKLDTWIGSDENKLAVQVNLIKAESKVTQSDLTLLYRHAISDYWDVQAGLNYENKGKDQTTQAQAQNSKAVVFGLHGLAPYFFETEANVSIASNYIRMNVESSRELLLSQTLVLQPYIDVETILYQQQGKNLKLSELKTGIQLRYEPNKHIMPFIDVAYGYEASSSYSQAKHDPNTSEKGGIYSVGVQFLF